MKIDKLITVFENLIPIYQKAVDTNATKDEIYGLWLQYGFCKLSKQELQIDISEIFDDYYKDYVTHDECYLFPTVNWDEPKHFLKKCIIPRLNFLKEQIIELNKLKKQGYTHV